MKGNLLLGTAQGKLGDIVLSRKNGEQNARVRVRSIKNPKSDGQNVQRLIVTLISRAYSRMRSLTDHSFQGFETGSPCQSRFNQLNMNLARQAAAIEVAGQGTADDYWNFIEKETYGLAYNPYILSTGSLANNLTVNAATDWAALVLDINLSVATLTYQDVCDLIGCQPGDQLTFAVMFGQHPAASGVAKGFTYGRVILWPSNGDMSSPFVNGGGEIQFPNARNEGKVEFFQAGQDHGIVRVNGVGPLDPDDASVSDHAYGALAVVVSRLEGNTWLRSNSQFVVAGNDIIKGLGITDLYPGYGDGSSIQFSNPLYLNNAQNDVVANNNLVLTRVYDDQGSVVLNPQNGKYRVEPGQLVFIYVRGSGADPGISCVPLSSGILVSTSVYDPNYGYRFDLQVGLNVESGSTFVVKIGSLTIPFEVSA